MSIVGRRKLDHPALGTAGGTALYASIENIYTVISNDDAGRYFTYTLANSATATFDHNFGVPLGEIKTMIYTGTFPTLTPVLDPLAAGWTIVATSGSLTTKIDVTAPSTGGPFTGVVFIIHDRNNWSITGALEGQGLYYDNTLKQFKNGYEKWTSEAAAITANVLTPSTARPVQRITTGGTDLQMIANPTLDKMLLLVNETGADIKIKNNTGATAANRIFTGTGSDFTLKSNAAVIAFYDSSLLRYVLMGGGAGGGLVTRYVNFANSGTTVLEYGYHYLIDTSGGAFTLALPTAVNENVIKFSDFASTFATNNFNLTTTQKIATQAVGENFLMDSNDMFAELSYYTDRFVLNTPLVSSGSSTTTSGGGLIPIEVSSSPPSPSNNTFYEVDLTTATVVIPFPIGTGAASIGVLDALRLASPTKFIRVTPPSGQKFDGFLTDEPIIITTPGSWAYLYRAAGSLTIRGVHPQVSTVAPGFLPGYTGSTAITTGNIGEVLTSLTQVITSVAGASGVLYDTGWSIPNVQPGIYRLDGSFIIATGGLGLTDLALIGFIATDGSNNVLSPINSYVSVTGYEQQIQAGHIGHPIQVTAVSTVKMRFRRISGVGSGTLTTLQQRGDLAGQTLTLTRTA